MIAFDPRLATSFTAGLLASINPCGFVLLPTYLLYFLGIEGQRTTTERSSIPRALAVSLAVSAGFMTVFVAIGTITKIGTGWFLDKSPWISLAVGIGLIVLGIAMLFGYRLPLTSPRLDVGGRDRSVLSMYVFGITLAKREEKPPPAPPSPLTWCPVRLLVRLARPVRPFRIPVYHDASAQKPAARYRAHGREGRHRDRRPAPAQATSRAPTARAAHSRTQNAGSVGASRARVERSAPAASNVMRRRRPVQPWSCSDYRNGRVRSPE